jgi:hypothetical protein
MPTPSLSPESDRAVRAPAGVESRALGRITPVVLASGAIAASAALALGGRTMGVAATVGAALASMNWLAIGWILRRVLAGSARTRAALLSLLAAKMGLMGLVVYVCLGPLGLDAAGLGVGLSALVAGILLGSLGGAASDVGAPAEPPTPSEDP